jgi:hypothetical protein
MTSSAGPIAPEIMDIGNGAAGIRPRRGGAVTDTHRSPGRFLFVE